MVWWVVRKRKHESQRKALYESIWGGRIERNRKLVTFAEMD
jgi:hypothetical protein